MSVRVLIAQLPRLLQDIVDDLLANAPDIEVTESGVPQLRLQASIASQHPHVVILACEEGEVERVSRHALGADRAKVLAMTRGGREAYLFELHPRQIPLGEVSPGTLLGAIRNAERLQ